MSPRTYTIKPLVWRRTVKVAGVSRHIKDGWQSIPDKDYYVGIWNGQRKWKCYNGSALIGSADSAIQGKALCTAEHERRLLACLDEVGWRPIESVPRDGTEIMVWDDREGLIPFLYWDKDIDHTTGKPWGWMSRTFHWSGRFNYWMPLPNPPKTEGEV